LTQIKIYGNTQFLNEARRSISDVIHSCLVDAIALPPNKRFHRFLPLDSEDFIYPADRSQKYLIVEISLFEGRSVDAKKNLIRLLFERLSNQVGILPIDLEITMIETPRHNWGIRGLPADELMLEYKVEQ